MGIVYTSALFGKGRHGNIYSKAEMPPGKLGVNGNSMID